MKHTLPSQAFTALSKKAYKSILVLAVALSLSLSSLAHRAEPFILGCVSPGQPMNIDAYIFSAGGNTMYQWQFRDNSGNWRCFVNGNNVINGVNFTVTSGATGGPVANDAPLLRIASAGTALENVLVRVLMRDNTLPACVTSGPNSAIGFTPTGDVYGGDDQALDETKYLRLHVFASATLCPPNAFACTNNMLVASPVVPNFNGYYGGFENISYDNTTGVYVRNNFGTNAGTDYSNGAGTGQQTYMDINNPYAKSTTYGRNIAPHSGNYQMVVEGANSTVPANDRVWYKQINVSNGTQYRFDVWVCRIDATVPVIQLLVNNGAVTTFNTSGFAIGEWKLIHVSYKATTTGPATFSIYESTGGKNFAIDDICLSVCTNCAALPLHTLDLRANLQGNNVSLKFTAENELNTNKFVIERSLDGVTYNEIGFKLPTGPVNTPTDYNFTDDLQNIGNAALVYYRIKAQDNDSRVAYSNIATVRLNKTAGVQIWPNPFGDYVNITYNASANSKIDVSLVSSLGKAIKKNSYSVTRGLNQISLNGLETLSSGVYFVRITDQNTNEVYIQKITK